MRDFGICALGFMLGISLACVIKLDISNMKHQTKVIEAKKEIVKAILDSPNSYRCDDGSIPKLKVKINVQR